MRGTSGARRHVFLLGHGISYSASPAMHNAAFGALGLDWTYELLDVPPAELPDAIRRLRSPDTSGANVTIPYNRRVMDNLDASTRRPCAPARSTPSSRSGPCIMRRTP